MNTNFTKVQFKEYWPQGLRSILLLNISEKVISYQQYSMSIAKEYAPDIPVIEGVEFRKYGNSIIDIDTSRPARVMKNGKNGFKTQLIGTEKYVYDVINSYSMKLSDEDIANILPYCDASDFEPFRDKEMDMKDPGYIGYRDEINMHFEGITDSYIPYMKLPMDYFYDEAHEWPSEKLYRVLLELISVSDKKMSKAVGTQTKFSLITGGVF